MNSDRLKFNEAIISTFCLLVTLSVLGILRDRLILRRLSKGKSSLFEILHFLVFVVDDLSYAPKLL